MNIGMIFGFIFVIIVIAFLLIIGSDMIAKFLGVTDEGQINSQIAKLKNTVCPEWDDTGQCGGGLYWQPKDYSERFDFSFTSSMKSVCFLDYENPSQNVANNWFGDSQFEPIIKNQEYNLVIYKKSGEAKGYHIAKLKPNENFCISQSMELLLTSKGQFVEVN